ncbi:F-box only protein 6-like isoform X2 [Ascaphus truei]|uniref:F-box only protein 6-like isoform X2 n=1 Tax=Ascaphus truei TaxID=8439 RepID=UPI003F59EA22
MLSINHLPENVLLDVLSLVPARDLAHRCRPVCSLWRDIIDSPTLWKRKCHHKGFISKDCKRNPRDWKIFYFICSLKGNLLQNQRANQDLKFWNIEQNGGDHWKIENLPGEHGQEFLDKQVKKSCKKSQLIELKRKGYSDELMDVVQPDIVVKDWFAPRRDCGCKYEVLVQLLSKDKETLQEFCPEPVIMQQWSDAQWQQMKHTFRNYGTGVRYIYFQHGGQDTQFWAGWYGVRVTDSSVTIEAEDLSV